MTPMPALTQQIRFCASPDGARIAYATSGSGAPLVKASNWLSHLEFDWQSPVWMHLLQELARGHTLVRYDERGCGLSDWDAELSFEHWVRDLEAVVDACGLDSFPLLGISQGASIAIAYAVRHPERVTHLILHGGYARGRLHWSRSESPKEEAEVMIRLAEVGWGQHNPAFRQFFTTQFIPGGSPEQHQWFNDLERISTSPQNAGRFMRIFNEIDVVALLSKVACPTLVFHGSRMRAYRSRKDGSLRRIFRVRDLSNSRRKITCRWRTSRHGNDGWMSSAPLCPQRRRGRHSSTR